MLLHNGAAARGIIGRPSTAFTRSLIDDAGAKVPRLRELTEVALRNFLIDEESIGIPCTKYRAAIGNGWTFPPLPKPAKLGPAAMARSFGTLLMRSIGVTRWERREWRVVWSVEGVYPLIFRQLFKLFQQLPSIPSHSIHTPH